MWSPGVVEVSEFLHELFRVEGPAFAVAGGPADVAPPLVEQFAPVGGGGHLQVVAGDAFVVDGGGFGPGGEGVLARGHGPPHAAGAGEVVGGAGVVDAAFVGGGDEAFQFLHDVRDVEVDAGQLRDGFVGEFLHPGLERVGAFDLPGRIVVQDFLGFGDGGAGLDGAGHHLLFSDQAVQFLHAPGVRFLQVHGGAQEGP